MIGFADQFMRLAAIHVKLFMPKAIHSYSRVSLLRELSKKYKRFFENELLLCSMNRFCRELPLRSMNSAGHIDTHSTPLAA